MEDTKASDNFDLQEFVNKYSPFLSEIRKRIIYTVIIFLIASSVGFLFHEHIIRFLIELLSLKGINIVFTSPFQFINLAISCGLASGLIIVFPLLIYQILSFLKPALKRKEFRMVVGFLPFSISLFLIGFSFGIFIMKWQIKLFLSQSVSLGIGNILDISHLIGTVLLVSAVMGLAFQFPVIILLLLRLGVLKPEHLSKQRLWIYLGALLFIFVLPVDSLLADFILALPLIILFELTLILNWLFNRRT